MAIAHTKTILDYGNMTKIGLKNLLIITNLYLPVTVHELHPNFVFTTSKKLFEIPKKFKQ